MAINETSKPTIAASWLGYIVEADEAIADEDQPYSTPNDPNENCKPIPIRGTLELVFKEGVYIDEIAVKWPIRLIEVQ